MAYVMHEDLTCLAQAGGFNAGHFQIERYEFLFEGSEKALKQSVRSAVREAMEAREKRGVQGGRLHVELDSERPGAGRVVDHVPRWSTPDAKVHKLAGEEKAGK